MDKRRDIQRAAEEIEELFDDLWQVFPFARTMRRGYRPHVDVYRTEDPPTFVVHVELPGIDAGDVKLLAGARGVIVSGERRRPKDGGHYEQMEIAYGPFQRQVMLTENVDPDGAAATYDRGILSITLPIAPKPPRQENVTIQVTVTP
ncbi:MAG: Hsp20/alpha crystallin family protein [Gaiellaceae bacterium]